MLFRNEYGIVFSPDEQGNILLHFGNVMRVTPFLKVEFENPDLWVDKLEGNCTKLRFVVKNRKYGNQVVKDATRIKIINLVLDAEIYPEDDFIPDGFLKAKNTI